MQGIECSHVKAWLSNTYKDHSIIARNLRENVAFKFNLGEMIICMKGNRFLFGYL